MGGWHGRPERPPTQGDRNSVRMSAAQTQSDLNPIVDHALRRDLEPLRQIWPQKWFGHIWTSRSSSVGPRYADGTESPQIPCQKRLVTEKARCGADSHGKQCELNSAMRRS